MSAFRFVDLFAGVGGFHHALSALGGHCELAVEFDEDCQRVYRVAFPKTTLFGDIRDITQSAAGEDATLEQIDRLVPDHDVLCAGFPCQPFSKSGAQLGIRDQTRGTLFHEIMEIVRVKQPRYLILENVPNLAGPRHTDTWAMIVDALREAGYRVSRTPLIQSPHRLPPPYGSPQVRDRVFILATRDPDHSSQEDPPLLAKIPEPTWNPSDWNLEKELDEAPGNRYAIRETERVWLSAWDWLIRNLEEDVLPGFPLWVDDWTLSPHTPADMPEWKQDFVRKNSTFYREHKDLLDEWRSLVWDSEGTRVRDFPASRRKLEWQAREAHPTRTGRTIWDLLVHFRPSGIRVRPATYVPALVAITQTSVVARRGRRLSPLEAARLQQLPAAPFVKTAVPDDVIYRQVGNAVHAGVVKYVASALFKAGGNAEWAASEPEILSKSA